MKSKREARDVVVIGGGPAGLTAALYLGRARKSALVIDGGSPRHAVSDGVHNFLTREGMPPAALRETAWEQMSAYPSVGLKTTTVIELERDGELWHVRTEDGTDVSARAVLLATGMVDEHPSLPGFQERWGHSIHHCPFCHGWEMRDQPLAVLSHGPAAAHFVPLLRNWSDDVVLLTHGHSLSDEEREAVTAARVPIYDTPIAALEGPGKSLARIRLADGTTLERQGLFVKATQKQVRLVDDLGVRFDEHGFVEVDQFHSTSLPMVWAAGDLTSGFQQVVEAAAQGARAATMMIATLTETPA